MQCPGTADLQDRSALGLLRQPTNGPQTDWAQFGQTCSWPPIQIQLVAQAQTAWTLPRTCLLRRCGIIRIRGVSGVESQDPLVFPLLLLAVQKQHRSQPSGCCQRVLLGMSINLQSWQ